MTNNPDTNSWIPHKPETWEFRFARLRAPLVMRHYTGRWVDGNPEFKETQCEAGQQVKIVMVSRFGDAGITDDLTAEFGYGARVYPDDLYDFSQTL